MKIIQPTDLRDTHFGVSKDISIIRPILLSDADSIQEVLDLAKSKAQILTDYNLSNKEEITQFWPIHDERFAVVEVFEDLDFKGVPVNLPNTKFILKQREDLSYPRLILGGDSNKTWNPNQNIGVVLTEHFSYRDLSPKDITTVEIQGAKNQEISISHTEKIYISMNGSNRSVAYSTFKFNYVGALVIGDPNDESTWWCNENKFFLNRIFSLEVYGKYNHNNNHFHGGSFDYRNSKIVFGCGRHNLIEGVRLEEISRIEFSSTTSNNIIRPNWHSSIQKNFQYGTKVYELIDKGSLNRIIPSVVDSSLAQRVALITKGLERSTGWDMLVRSNYFDIEAFKDAIIFDWDNPNAAYLVVCECYDIQGNLIKPDLIESPFLTWNAQNNRLQGNYQGGQNYGTRYLIIKDPRVAYLRVGLNNNNRTGEPSTRFAVDVYSEKPRFVWS